MTESRRYLICLAGGTVGLFFLWFVIFYAQLWLPKSARAIPASRWANELFKNKTQSAKKIEGKRLFIVGGSNTHFAVNAEKISKELGIPTINFGTHAGLRPEYFFHKVKKILRSGDTVLLALEYSFYEDYAKYTKEYIDYLIAHDRQFFLSLPILAQLHISLSRPFSKTMTSYQQIFSPPVNSENKYHMYTYFTTPYGDTYGNNKLLMNFNTRILRNALNKMPEKVTVSENGPLWDDLSKFSTWCKNNEVKLIATAPNHMDFNKNLHKSLQFKFDQIKALFARADIPFIGDPFKAMFHKKYYFDTVYHPNHLGKKRYTLNLIKTLKKEAPELVMNPAVKSVVVKDSYIDPFDLILTQFNGWENLKGLGSFNGPYPSDNLPIVVWGNQEVILKTNSSKNKSRVLSIAFRPRFDKQRVHIFIDGESVWDNRVAYKPAFYHLKLPMPPRSGKHIIKIQSDNGDSKIADPNNLVILFKSLIVKTA